MDESKSMTVEHHACHLVYLDRTAQFVGTVNIGFVLPT